MADGGLDLATLGLRVDARPVQDATKALGELTQAGVKAEAQAGLIGKSSEREFRRAALAAREGARAQVEAIEQEYQLAEATIKEAAARGFLSPKEAAQAGREAAKAYNSSLVQVIDRVQSAGGLNRSSREGAAAFVQLTGNLKNVDAAGRRAGLGLGRLNDAFVTVARQATGTSPVVGKLVDTIGTFAIGTAYMVPVLAGIAAIGFAWQKITEDARDARKAQDEAITSALRAAQIRDLGAAGTAAEELEASVAAEARIRARLSELQEQLGRAQQSGSRNRVEGTSSRIQATIDELREAEAASAELRKQVFENVSRENDRLQAERDRANTSASKSADEAVRIEEQKARSLERLAAETARREQQSTEILRGLDLQADSERRLAAAQLEGSDAIEAVNRELAREAHLREALAGAVPRDVAAITARVNAIHDEREAAAEAGSLREQVQKDVAESLKKLAEAQERFAEEDQRIAEEAAASAQAWRDAWVNAAVDVAAAFGQSAGNAAAFAANVAFQGPAAIPGFAAAAVGSILDSRSNRAAEVEAARAEFDRVLDDYVATLADRSRFEQLAADAESGAKGALDALVNSLLADLSTRGSFGADAAQAIRDAIAHGLDAQGLEGILGSFGAEGQEILDTYLEHLRRIDEQRQEEIASAENSLAVRALMAQGLDDEAEALRRRLAYEEEAKAAFELGGQALEDYTRSVQEQEEAAIAAAAAAREAADALRQVNFGLSLAQDVYSVRGQDREAFEAGLEIEKNNRIADARKQFEDGLISEAAFTRIAALATEIFNGKLDQYDENVRSAAAAALEAAKAEEYRQQVDLENLRVRLLVSQGLDDEAFALKQQLELLDAVEQGRSGEYIALLKQVQAQEAANRAADKAKQAAEEQTAAQEDLARAIDGTLQVIGGPAGLTRSIRTYRNQALRYGGTPFDVSSPDFSGGQGTAPPIAVDQIHVHASPGMDVRAIAEEIYDAVVEVGQRRTSRGGYNRVGGF